MIKDDRRKLTAQIDVWPPNAAFAADWNSLLEHTPFASPFDHLEWIEIGVSLFAKEAKILPCRFLDREGTLACMGIFRMTEESGKLLPRTVVRTIEFNSQRITPFIGADQQTMANAIEALREIINKPVDSFDFFKLDPQGGTIEKLSGILEAKSIPHSLELFNEQPYFPLVGT